MRSEVPIEVVVPFWVIGRIRAILAGPLPIALGWAAALAPSGFDCTGVVGAERLGCWAAGSPLLRPPPLGPQAVTRPASPTRQNVLRYRPTDVKSGLRNLGDKGTLYHLAALPGSVSPEFGPDGRLRPAGRPGVGRVTDLDDDDGGSDAGAPDGGMPRMPARRSGVPQFFVQGTRIDAGSIAPGLHVVATPIGHLGDISLRALATLAAADAVLAEDTRTSRVLLAHYGIETPMIPYHEHNAAAMRPQILGRLGRGETLALISDAGTPLVSDPGYKLVAAAIEAGLAVTAAPGASAVMAGLVLAGLPTDRFFFEGFLPPKSAARRSRLAELKRIPATLVLFESARRTAEALDDAAAVLGPRQAAVARELTKRFETVRRGTLPRLAAEFAAEGTPKGEIVLLIGPPGEADAPSDETIAAQLRAALRTMSVKDAAAMVAGSTGEPRREIYARALALAAEAREPE